MSTTPLPPLLAGWAEAALGGPLPAETRATCARCSMCAGNPGGPEASERAFLPDVKCCSYTPTLPNYALGLLLADESPELQEGRDRVLDRLIRGLGVTPLGMGPGPGDLRRRERANQDEEFGRRPDLVCPYFDRGRCTIWRHRETVCATFFCKTEGGLAGADFWQATRQLLRLAEEVLALHCLRVLGFSAAQLDELVDATGAPRRLDRGELRGWVDPDGRVAPELAHRLWGRWFDQEAALYLACADVVRKMTWDDVRAVGGVRLALAEDRARALLAARRAPRVPARLYVGQIEGEPLASGEVSVRSSDLPYDPIHLSAEAWETLAAGDVSTFADGPFLPALLARGILVGADGRDEPPDAAPPGPTRPTDRLRFFRWYRDRAVELTRAPGPDGGAQLVLSCGAQQTEIDEPDLFHFAEQLVRFQNGFRAADATAWGPDGGTMEWARVQELLDALRRDGVLRVVSEDERGRSGGALSW
jgi:hypothetical protein